MGDNFLIRGQRNSIERFLNIGQTSLRIRGIVFVIVIIIFLVRVNWLNKGQGLSDCLFRMKGWGNNIIESNYTIALNKTIIVCTFLIRIVGLFIETIIILFNALIMKKTFFINILINKKREFIRKLLFQLIYFLLGIITFYILRRSVLPTNRIFLHVDRI